MTIEKGNQLNVDRDEVPARKLFSSLSGRLNRQHPTPVVLDDNSQALLVLQNYEQSGQGWFWATDAQGKLTYLTDNIAEVLKPSGGSLLGTEFASLFSHGEDKTGNRRTLAFALAKQTRFNKLSLVTSNAEKERWWEVSGSPYFDGNGDFCGFRGSGVDVTEQRHSTEEASQLAMYDDLTGLTNRRRMAQVLDSTMLAFTQQKRSCSIIMVDLDRFKQVNDTLGHPAGDALLKQVSERLLKIIIDKEKVCRLGGDEFQIILPDEQDREKLSSLASHIIYALSQPYMIEDARCVIGASVGIAISPEDGKTSDELIRNADLALYAAKGGGRGRFCFFLEEDLRDAVANGEMSMYYQPIVCAKTNCVKGLEALIRWNHPERGMVSPAHFIPIAEEANLIEGLGEWALYRSCEEAATWPGKLRVAVNVSPIQFANSKFPEIVKAALTASKLRPDRLELEITEGIFLGESAETDAMFKALKNIGVRLALDDFGTGYSSLGYLRKAPFDKIKIDQSFVRGVTEPGSRNGAIIAAIVALANAVNMETTAEGIESFDQLELIRGLNVSHIQGYIYSKPVDHVSLMRNLKAGDWVIEPTGPARQRDDRQSVYRSVNAVHDDHCYQVVIRNLSITGALMEGLVDVPIGTRFVLDLGEGQLVVATVRRSVGNQQGVEFDERLISDGNGGLCTRHRISNYLLARLGLPEASARGPGLSFISPASLTKSLPAFKVAKLWNSARPLDSFGNAA